MEEKIMRAKLVILFFVVLIANPLSAQELTGTLQQIKKSGQIRIGYRVSEPPMSFLNKDGQWERTPFLNPKRGDIRDLMDALLEFHEFEKMLEGWAQRARPFSLHISSQFYD